MSNVYLKNVVTLKLNTDKCTGCKMCTIVCPHSVFEIVDKKAKIMRKDACMECGACFRNCPDNAIEVKSGVGCAYGIIRGILKGTEPTCDCSNQSDNSKNSCC